MRTTALLLCLGLVTACGPLVMIPGGELSGTVKPAPADWAFSQAIETVQLETRPDDPYSVNVWGVDAGEHFYVAGDSGNRWAANIEQDPRVRLKVGDDIFELRAVRTDEDAEVQAFRAGLKSKYDHEPDADDIASATLYRLEPR